MVYVTNDKREYVAALDTVLAALNSFDACEYAINDITQQEYMRVRDRFGAVAYFDITGMTHAEILKDVCKMLLMDQARTPDGHSLVPESMVVDNRKLLKASDLFRR
jgi:hypothetical protein